MQGKASGANTNTNSKTKAVKAAKTTKLTNAAKTTKATKAVKPDADKAGTAKATEAEKFASCIALTGVRDEEFIRGIGLKTKDTVMQLRFTHAAHTIYPPSFKFINDRSALLLRDKFRFGFFKGMSEEEAISYVRSHAVKKEPYLEDIPGLQLCFVKIGGEFLELPEEDQRVLMQDTFVSVETVYDMFFRKGNKKSLLLRPTNFELMNYSLQSLDEVKCDLFVDLLTGEESRERFPERRVFPVSLQRFSVKEKGENRPMVVGFCDDPTPNSGEYKTAHMHPEILRELRWFTPSMHKALLQKCIRVGAERVAFPSQSGKTETSFSALETTLTTFFALMESGGSFVPDLQLFVSGGESAFKRLAIILIEDAVITPSPLFLNKPDNALNALFGAALCFRQFKQAFRPSQALLERVVQLCADALVTPQCYKYSREDTRLDKITSLNAKPCIRLLEELRSFAGDILMVKDVVHRSFSQILCLPNHKRPSVMRAEHALDQHSLTDIAHFLFDPARPRMSMAEKFDMVWETTGQNPRRLKDGFRPHVLVTQAQLDLFLAKASLPPLRRGKESTEEENEDSEPSRVRKEEEGDDAAMDVSDEDLEDAESSNIRTSPNEPLALRKSLEPAWIAGLLGPLSSSTNTRVPTLTFVNPNNIAEFVSIRKPTRDKDISLTKKDKQAAQTEVREMLNTHWKKVREPMIGADFHVKLHDDEFLCAYHPEEVTLGEGNNEENLFHWDDFCNEEFCVSTFAVEETSANPHPLSIEGNVNLAYHPPQRSGVYRRAFALLESALRAIDTATLSRLAMYVRPIARYVRMHPIARDGTGTLMAPDWTDSYVFRFLQQLCVWFPGMIRTDATLKFTVVHFPLWQHVRSVILQSLSTVTPQAWKNVQFCDPRELRKHQREALVQILDRIQNNKRGHLVWMEMGQGKTFIVTSLIARMIEQKVMPKYCVYALPRSAMTSVTNEFKMGGLPVCVVSSSIKEASATVFRPHAIYFVEHDTLQKIRQQLIAIAPEMFFVIDELHLLMNPTLRTSSGLELANLASDFVGMTGTFIKDSDPKSVIQWLRMVSDFPITDKNYMIGVASLVSRKMNLGIAKDMKLFSVEMPAEIRREYEGLVTERFGGHAQRTNLIEAVKVCHEVVYKAIVDRVVELVMREKQQPIFVVAKDRAYQERMVTHLSEKYGIQCMAINSKASIDLPADISSSHRHASLQVIVTTPQHSTGYTLTKAHIMVTGVYYSNQATREQLVGRIHRMGQRAKTIVIETYHTGLLSYTQNHYEDARALMESLKDMVSYDDGAEEDDSLSENA